MAQAKFVIEWNAHEYEHKERSKDWFWAVGIIAVSVAVVSIILSNIIFAILVLVATFTLCLFINRPPEEIHVVVNEHGVTKDKVLYPFSTLHSFWIDEEHPHKKIMLRSQKSFMPLILIPLGEGVNVENLKRNLLQNLTEEFQNMPFAEKVLEYLGF